MDRDTSCASCLSPTAVTAQLTVAFWLLDKGLGVGRTASCSCVSTCLTADVRFVLCQWASAVATACAVR
jgi:hypothetical protein